LPISARNADNAKTVEERKVLSKLLVDEGDTIRNLSDQVEKVKDVFRIENPTGRVIFQNFGDLSDPKRIAALLLGKYFAQRLGLIENNWLSLSGMAQELGRPLTALSGPARSLIDDGLVEKLPIRKYRIIYHRIPDLIEMLYEKRKSEKS
jgi:hypothetical protein